MSGGKPDTATQEAATAAAAAAAAEQAAAQQAAQEQPAEQAGGGSTAPTEGEDDDEENETCGFCKFMKGGGCRTAFVAWSKCVDNERESGGDFTEECREKTMALRDCMLQHADYYRPMLEEEEEAMKERDEELAAGQAEGASGEQGGAAAAVAADVEPAAEGENQ